MEYQQINNGESGLSVRTKLNAMLQGIIEDTTGLPGKMVRISEFTTGNVPQITANGMLEDSGKKVSDFVLTRNVVDSLIETYDNYPLSARQGNILNNTKVDKVTGKSLSDRNFTEEEKIKLANIAIEANKYILPEAGASLGGVKSGGDVTISAGLISVNDDSHNHIISNVDGLQTALGNRELLSNKVPSTSTLSGASTDSEYPSAKLMYNLLGSGGGLQTLTNLVTAFQGTPDNTHYPSEKLVADSLALKISTALKGIPNGVAELDADGFLVASQLPGSVPTPRILEGIGDSYPSVTSADEGKHFWHTVYKGFYIVDATGDWISSAGMFSWEDTLWVLRADNTYWRYVEPSFDLIQVSISPLVLGELSTTAYRGDRGKTAYDFSQNLIDNLTTDDATKPLSAKQGKLLQDNKMSKVSEAVAGRIPLLLSTGELEDSGKSFSDILLAENIVNELGDSETQPISQKAVTDELALKAAHGYASSPKTLKQVDDSLVQLAGDVTLKTDRIESFTYFSSFIKSYRSDYIFKGVAKVGDPTPSALPGHVYKPASDGVIFGVSVNGFEDKILVGNITSFVLETIHQPVNSVNINETFGDPISGYYQISDPLADNYVLSANVIPMYYAKQGLKITFESSHRTHDTYQFSYISANESFFRNGVYWNRLNDVSSRGLFYVNGYGIYSPSLAPDASSSFSTTGFIPIHNKAKILLYNSYSGNGWVRCAFYDKNRVPIRGSEINDSNGSISIFTIQTADIPENARYIRVTCIAANTSFARVMFEDIGGFIEGINGINETIETVEINVNARVGDPVSGFYQISDPLADNYVLSEDVLPLTYMKKGASITFKVNTYEWKTYRLVYPDVYEVTFRDGASWLDVSNNIYSNTFNISGRITPTGGFDTHAPSFCTNYIPINREKNIELINSFSANNIQARYAFYDKNRIPIDGFVKNDTDGTLTKYIIQAADIPENARYIRATCLEIYKDYAFVTNSNISAISDSLSDIDADLDALNNRVTTIENNGTGGDVINNITNVTVEGGDGGKIVLKESDIAGSTDGYYSFHAGEIKTVNNPVYKKAIIGCQGATRISLYSFYQPAETDVHDGNYIIFTNDVDEVIYADRCNPQAEGKYVDYQVPPLATKCYLAWTNSTWRDIYKHSDEFPFEIKINEITEIMEPTESWESSLINFFSIVKVKSDLLYMYYSAFENMAADNFQSLCFAYSTDDGLNWIKSVPREVVKLTLGGAISANEQDTVTLTLDGTPYTIELIGTETNGKDVANSIYNAWLSNPVAVFSGWSLDDPGATGIIVFRKEDSGECEAPLFSDNNSLGITWSFERVILGKNDIVPGTNILVDGRTGNAWREHTVLYDDLDSEYPFKIFYCGTTDGVTKMYMAKSSDGLSFTDIRMIYGGWLDTQIQATINSDGNYLLFVRNYVSGVRAIGVMIIGRDGRQIRQPWSIDRALSSYQAPFLQTKSEEFILFPTMFDPVNDTIRIEPLYWDKERLFRSYIDLTNLVLGSGYRAWGVVCGAFHTTQFKDEYIFYTNGRDMSHDSGATSINSRFFRVKAFISRK